MGPLQDHIPAAIDFFEIAPENWLGVGGRLGEAFDCIAGERPLVCHGLLLDLGGPDPLDTAFIARLKQFLDRHNAVIYGDHLSFCAAHGQLYELLPIPFTEEAVLHVAARIRQVQELLGRRIAIENASYYLTLSNDLDEVAFLNAVLDEADCDLLLDINNIFVNSVNHQYDAEIFLGGIPPDRIAYAHMAGHANEADDLIVDTHGAAVIDSVWGLLEFAYKKFGVFPTLLERDENIPPLPELMREVQKIRDLQSRYANQRGDAAA
jgi:uncharacterized protein